MRVSPMRRIEESEEKMITHDVMFEHRDGDNGGSMNASTYVESIPARALAGVIHGVLQSVVESRVHFRDRRRLPILQRVSKTRPGSMCQSCIEIVEQSSLPVSWL